MTVNEMNRHKFILIIFIWLIFLGLTACSNHSVEKSVADQIEVNKSPPTSQQTPSSKTDSLITQKDELTKIYTQAIAEFIKAAYQMDKTSFDTLYFGKHIYGQEDDFPDIELPESIEKTQIRLISPELGQKKQTERKSLVYVNMMGWVDIEKSEFIFVVFKNSAEHHFDYYINFSFNASTNKFELDKIEFENYVNLNRQKPKRITIFKKGKYVGDK